MSHDTHKREQKFPMINCDQLEPSPVILVEEHLDALQVVTDKEKPQEDR